MNVRSWPEAVVRYRPASCETEIKADLGSKQVIDVRQAAERDGEGILDVHTRSVREICGPHYPPEQIEEWAGSKSTEFFKASMADGETFVVAEDDSRIVGFGVLVDAEVRALFVDPEHTGKNIASQILQTMEQMAMAAGLLELHLKSSLNAVEFYRRKGYQGDKPARHELASGTEMACVAMAKVFDLGGVQ